MSACSAEKYEEYMREYSKLRVQRLFDINDPNYTWYRPEIDPTADAYLVLLPYTTNCLLNRTIIAVYIPEYVCNIFLRDANSNIGVTINLDTPPDPSIDVILSQTRALPELDLTISTSQLAGYHKIMLGTPFLGNGSVIYSTQPFIFYTEELYFTNPIKNSPTIVKICINNDVTFMHLGLHFWNNIKNARILTEDEYCEIDCNLLDKINDARCGNGILSQLLDAIYAIRRASKAHTSQ